MRASSMPAGTSLYTVHRCRKCFVSVDNGLPMSKGHSVDSRCPVHDNVFLNHDSSFAGAASPLAVRNSLLHTLANGRVSRHACDVNKLVYSIVLSRYRQI